MGRGWEPRAKNGGGSGAGGSRREGRKQDSQDGGNQEKLRKILNNRLQ